MRKLKKLKQLQLDGCAITDAGLAHLERMPELGHVMAHRTRVTKAGVERLIDGRPVHVFSVSWDRPQEKK